MCWKISFFLFSFSFLNFFLCNYCLINSRKTKKEKEVSSKVKFFFHTFFVFFFCLSPLLWIICHCRYYYFKFFSLFSILFAPSFRHFATSNHLRCILIFRYPFTINSNSNNNGDCSCSSSKNGSIWKPIEK